MDSEMETRFSRRGFLRSASKLAAGAAVGAAGLSAIAASAAPEAADTPEWKFKPVDPEKVYWNGVDGYNKSACGMGSYTAISQELGAPFTSIPQYVTRWGEGGIVGEGSQCGALIGSSTAIALAFGSEPAVATALIKELNAWYRQELGHGSTLCHQSVTEWAKDNGVGVESQERKDRCARVTGETAKKAVLLMTAQAGGSFKAVMTGNNPNSVPCITCHGSSGSGSATVRNGVAATDCKPCHGDAHKQ